MMIRLDWLQFWVCWLMIAVVIASVPVAIIAGAFLGFGLFREFMREAKRRT